MKPHHFKLSKLSELMTYDQYVELNEMHLKTIPTDYKYDITESLKKKKGSNLLTALIIKHAGYNGFKFDRTNNIGIPIVNKATEKLEGWRPSQAKRGSILDIGGNIYGEKLEIEIKYGKDRLSQGQREHIEAVQNRGGLAFVCRTYSDYIEQVTPYFDKEYFKQWKISKLNEL